MWQIQNCGSSYEYLTCKDDRDAIWTHCATYQVSFDPTVTEEYPGSIIGIPLPIQEPEIEILVKYQLPSGRLFEPYREIHIPQEAVIRETIPLSEVIEPDTLMWFETLSTPFSHLLELEVRKVVSLSSLFHDGAIDWSKNETTQTRRITICNRLPRGKAPLPPSLRNYRQVTGNLDKEIIWGITMFMQGRSESWQIETDKIRQPFDAETLWLSVSQALRIQTHPVLMRIPMFLKRQHPESKDNSLEVVIQIPEICPGEECTIDVTLRDPSQELFHPTGIDTLDECILDVNQNLLEYGIPVGPEHDKYQKILAHLLLYRRNCALYLNYISADTAKMTENEGFHKHLHSKLIDQLSIETIDCVFSEVDIGNSRVDLLIENIPTELKLEGRRRVTTDEIVERYQSQAADYIARQNAAFGFLVVLDTVLDRELPTSRVDQDVRVVQVPNVSGGSVAVVAIVIRIPRSASDFTVLAKKRG